MTSEEKKLCKKFKDDRTINPATGRKIKEGGPTYKELMNKCAKYFVEPKDAPSHPLPMGPFMLYSIEKERKVYSMIDIAKQIIPTLKHIQSALRSYKNKESYSKFDMDDHEKTLKSIKRWLSSLYALEIPKREQIIEGCDALLKDVQNFRKTLYEYDDTPKYAVVEDMEVKPDRFFLRNQVVRCFSLYKDTKEVMDIALKNNNITIYVSRGDLRDILDDKKYLDYLIKHKIFSHDDIYVNTFPHENVFEELKELHKKYMILYEKTK